MAFGSHLQIHQIDMIEIVVHKRCAGREYRLEEKSRESKESMELLAAN